MRDLTAHRGPQRASCQGCRVRGARDLPSAENRATPQGPVTRAAVWGVSTLGALRSTRAPPPQPSSDAPAMSMRVIKECRRPKGSLQRRLGSPHDANAPGSLTLFSRGRDPAVGALDVRDAELVDMAIKVSAMPLTCRPMPRAAELRFRGSVSLICATRVPLTNNPSRSIVEPESAGYLGDVAQRLRGQPRCSIS
jgi:hypothetical protein